MRYLSIDIETTGLDPEKCQIIEVGAVIDDLTKPDIAINDLPVYHCYVKQNEYSGTPFALSMHPEKFRRIANEEPGYNYLYPGDVWYDLKAFLLMNKWTEGPLILAGKNVASFDYQFLKRLRNFGSDFGISHKMMDPAMLYLRPDDDVLPGLDVCMDRAGIKGEVPHNAVDDAKLVIQVLRAYYSNKGETRDE